MLSLTAVIISLLQRLFVIPARLFIIVRHLFMLRRQLLTTVRQLCVTVLHPGVLMDIGNDMVRIVTGVGKLEEFAFLKGGKKL